MLVNCESGANTGICCARFCASSGFKRRAFEIRAESVQESHNYPTMNTLCGVASNERQWAEIAKSGFLSPVRLPFRHSGPEPRLKVDERNQKEKIRGGRLSNCRLYLF